MSLPLSHDWIIIGKRALAKYYGFTLAEVNRFLLHFEEEKIRERDSSRKVELNIAYFLDI